MTDVVQGNRVIAFNEQHFRQDQIFITQASGAGVPGAYTLNGKYDWLYIEAIPFPFGLDGIGSNHENAIQPLAVNVGFLWPNSSSPDRVPMSAGTLIYQPGYTCLLFENPYTAPLTVRIKRGRGKFRPNPPQVTQYPGQQSTSPIFAPLGFQGTLTQQNYAGTQAATLISNALNSNGVIIGAVSLSVINSVLGDSAAIQINGVEDLFAISTPANALATGTTSISQVLQNPIYVPPGFSVGYNSTVGSIARISYSLL